MFKQTFLLLASVLMCNPAVAQGDPQDFIGSTIIAAGEVEEYSCPGLGLYDCSGWPADLYRFTEQSICFTSSEFCGLGCSALIVEKEGQQSILLVGAGYSDKFSQASGQTRVCPEDVN